jgi:lipoic acid synthetase
VRPQADYARSLTVLETAKALNSGVLTKSGLMVGLGETFGEIEAVLEDLRAVDCDLLTIGQYLQPSRQSLPVLDFVLPEVFERYRLLALEMGFRGVASGPLVRSSMHADQLCPGAAS